MKPRARKYRRLKVNTLNLITYINQNLKILNFCELFAKTAAIVACS